MHFETESHLLIETDSHLRIETESHLAICTTYLQPMQVFFFLFDIETHSHLEGVEAYRRERRGADTIPHKIAKVTLKIKNPKNFEK